MNGNSPSDSITQAEQDVISERRRQVTEEHWTPQHDDTHADGSLALAGASYAAYAGAEALRAYARPQANRGSEYQFYARQIWPFDIEWLKRKNPRRDLVRAAALLIAEIERMDRESKGALDPDPYGLEGAQQ